MIISVSYGFVGGVITVTNAKSSAESEKLTLKISSESGKLFTIGCHFPLKSTNFGTLWLRNIMVSFVFAYNPQKLQKSHFEKMTS